MTVRLQTFALQLRVPEHQQLEHRDDAGGEHAQARTQAEAEPATLLREPVMVATVTRPGHHRRCPGN